MKFGSETERKAHQTAHIFYAERLRRSNIVELEVVKELPPARACLSVNVRESLIRDEK